MCIKNLVGILSINLLAVLLLAGCASLVWDENVPKEKSTIIMYTNLTIKTYNGINVKWPRPITWVKVQVPAGNTEFVFDYSTVTGTFGGIYGNDLRIVYNFEAGKIYALDRITWSEDGYTIALHDWETRKVIDYIPILGFK